MLEILQKGHLHRVADKIQDAKYFQVSETYLYLKLCFSKFKFECFVLLFSNYAKLQQ
jgi:hypothetical protein